MMVRMRRHAPSVLVIGAIVVALSTGGVAVAQLATTAKADRDVTDLVIDRLAYLVIANVTVWALVAIGMWRWSGARLKSAVDSGIEKHDANEDAHGPAAARNHAPLDDAIVELDKGMTAVLAELRGVSAQLVQVIGFDERLRKIEEQHAMERGQSRAGDPAGLDVDRMRRRL